MVETLGIILFIAYLNTSYVKVQSKVQVYVREDGRFKYILC